MQTSPTQHDRLWSIILAGGEGARMRPFIQRWLGNPRPKQYCTFVGTRSMLQHTLARADRLTAPERKVTVIALAHRREARWHFEDHPCGTVLLQPTNRDTAAGIFLPLTYVRARNPEATVVIYPSDHFVYPEDRFVEAVRRAVGAAEWLEDRLVLLGVAPDRLEVEYGWIQPSRQFGETVSPAVRMVQAFLEKPHLAEAHAALVSGALWNTMVLAAKVETLWQLGWRCVPELMPRFERVAEAFDCPEEDAVLNAVYQEMPARNFSSDVLQKAPDQVAVIELSRVVWSDWGKPERVVETLRRIDRQPAFPLELLAADPPVPGRCQNTDGEAEHERLPAAVPLIV